MKLLVEENENAPLNLWKKWRDEKYKEIDLEYEQKVRALKQEISKQEKRSVTNH